MVGLMRAVRGIATGYMGARVDMMTEKAKREREDEVRKAENEFDLHKQGDYLKGLLTNSIEIDNNKHTNSANERQQIIEDEQKRLGLHLDSIGMSRELQDILKPYTYDWETYQGYLEKNYPNLGDAWFKEKVPFPEFKDMTYEDFIIQGNKNFFNKDKNESNAQSTLQENNNVPSNASKVLTSRTLTEERAGVEGATVVSPFEPSFPESIEQQNIEQIALTGELPTEKEKQELLLQGAAIPSTLFMPEILSAEGITPGQRSTRSKDILNVIATAGNFKDIKITAEGIDLSGLYNNEKELTRHRMLIEAAGRWGRKLEAEEGVFYDASELFLRAMKTQSMIENMAMSHAVGRFDDVTKMALDAGVISIDEAYTRTLYQDLQDLSKDVGYQGLKYYLSVLDNLNMYGTAFSAADIKNAKDLANNIRTGVYDREPEGFNEIAEKVDNAILGSISLEGEDVYDADGNLIKEGDIDAPVFDIGSPGEKILGEEYLSEEEKKEEIKKKKITPITGDVSDYSEIIETLRAADEFDEPIRLDATATQKWRLDNINPDNIVITLADGSTQTLVKDDTFIEDKGIQGIRLQTVVEDMHGNLVLETSKAPDVKANPKIDKLETLVKTLNKLEKQKDIVKKTKTKQRPEKEILAERAKQMEQLRVEIAALLKELQPEE